MQLAPDNFKDVIWTIVRIVALAYGGLSLFLFFFQSRYVYYPSRDLHESPADYRLAYEEVLIPVAEGGQVAAWFVPATDPRGTILLCHGNGGNISHRLPAIELFHDMRLNVCIFDYRGYGRSTGKPGEETTYQDAFAAWNYLVQTRGIAPEQIVVLGRSLGGAVAAGLLDRLAPVRPAGLILEDTFTSLPDMAAKVYPILPTRLLCRFRYNTLQRLRSIHCPVLVAHSRQDEMIPFAMGERLYQAANEPKTFVELTGGHNDGESFTPAPYRRQLEVFLEGVLRLSVQRGP